MSGETRKLYDSEGNWIGIEQVTEMTLADWKRMRAALGADPELRRKWLEGSWETE